jgi:hypothetical protein
VYSRAHLSWIVVLVFALLLTAASTGAPAREFRSPDTLSENDPADPAPRHMGRLLDGNGNGRLQIRVFHLREPACQNARCYPAAAELTERLRKVE